MNERTDECVALLIQLYLIIKQGLMEYLIMHNRMHIESYFFPFYLLAPAKGKILLNIVKKQNKYC